MNLTRFGACEGYTSMCKQLFARVVEKVIYEVVGARQMSTEARLLHVLPGFAQRRRHSERGF
jgi:hypothetical protein